MPYGFCIYAYFFSDFCVLISLLLLTVTLRGVSNKHCLLSLFSFLSGICVAKIIKSLSEKSQNSIPKPLTQMYVTGIRIYDKKILICTEGAVFLCPSAVYMYIYEPGREKTNILHMRKQRRRSASR